MLITGRSFLRGRLVWKSISNMSEGNCLNEARNLLEFVDYGATSIENQLGKLSDWECQQKQLQRLRFLGIEWSANQSLKLRDHKAKSPADTSIRTFAILKFILAAKVEGTIFARRPLLARSLKYASISKIARFPGIITDLDSRALSRSIWLLAI